MFKTASQKKQSFGQPSQRAVFEELWLTKSAPLTKLATNDIKRILTRHVWMYRQLMYIVLAVCCHGHMENIHASSSAK